MSYCVNCGVELDPTASACPLCQTPVVNPRQPVDTELPPPFPSRREEVQPVNKLELALLLSAMLGSVAVVCGVLNLFFLHSGRPWSLYVIGAAVMLWIWLVPPLLFRGMPLWVRLGLDACAVGVYVYLISIDLHGIQWYLGLALPIILTGGAIMVALGLILSRGRSILTSVTLIIGAIGLFVMSIELYVDRWLHQDYLPGWSLVVAAVCVALIIPLVIVRRRPALRDEVRRRFHM
ncbi:DUF6320 domain-containing protein [Intestinimonas timonensis]|uniref:DUF6320 domain-containing protein n=1 Tax=Intestinimonas timonensis TaxID=1689270 RepID=UPI003A9174CF